MSNQTKAVFTEAQISAAGRALCDENAKVCGINADDNWKIYSSEFIEIARLAFNASDVASTIAAHEAKNSQLEKQLELVDRVVVGQHDETGAAPVGFDNCPITGREFWGNIDHPLLGYVATYGGPFDTCAILAASSGAPIVQITEEKKNG